MTIVSVTEVMSMNWLRGRSEDDSLPGVNLCRGGVINLGSRCFKRWIGKKRGLDTEVNRGQRELTGVIFL